MSLAGGSRFIHCQKETFLEERLLLRPLPSPRLRQTHKLLRKDVHLLEIYFPSLILRFKGVDRENVAFPWRKV